MQGYGRKISTHDIKKNKNTVLEVDEHAKILSNSSIMLLDQLGAIIKLGMKSGRLPFCYSEAQILPFSEVA